MAKVITDETFDAEIKQGVCLVDFYADWCGPCRMIAPVLEKLSKEFDGKVKIFKINVDQNQLIASKFGIRSIPTLIAFKDGKKVDIKMGAIPEAQLKAWINSLVL
jgi:thioredoxin 1